MKILQKSFQCLPSPLRHKVEGFVLQRMSEIEKDYDTICFEGDPQDKRLKDAYRLRWQVFSKELGWTPPTAYKEEKDKYDIYAIHFLVVSHEHNEVVAYIRALPPPDPFMCETIFRDLLSDDDRDVLRARKKETAEISRLALKKELRGKVRGFLLTLSLFKEIYKWSRHNNTRYLYMVSTQKTLRYFQALFPLKNIGHPKKYHAEHAVSAASVLDLREAEETIGQRLPNFYKWFVEEE